MLAPLGGVTAFVASLVHERAIAMDLGWVDFDPGARGISVANSRSEHTPRNGLRSAQLDVPKLSATTRYRSPTSHY